MTAAVSYVIKDGVVELVKIIKQTGAYGSALLTLDGQNLTNQPALKIRNIGLGDAGVVITGSSDQGSINLGTGGANPWETRYTNRSVSLYSVANAYAGGFNYGFKLYNAGHAATVTSVLIQGQSGQTGDLLRVTDSGGTSRFKVTPSGGVVADTTTETVYTVATLPAGTAGKRCAVSDALNPAFLAVVVGGGATFAPVIHNGANWIVG